MSKKTERKNKTNLVVKWPTTPLFTIEDIFSLNPDAKHITLRVRLTKEKIEKNLVGEVGSKTGGQGRPLKVYAFTPVPKSTIELAKTQNITLVEQARLQKIMAPPTPTPTPTPVNFTPQSQLVTA